MASRRWFLSNGPYKPPRYCCVCEREIWYMCYYKQYWFVCSPECYDVLLELGIIEERED